MYFTLVFTLFAVNVFRALASVVEVHVIAHTHDDPGWLKTYEQYLYGANNTIYFAGVNYILDTVTSTLEKDRNKKFSYAEMSFFTKWFVKLSTDKQEIVRGLVKNGQLTFINGGWCMHDEASSHYISMIDQTTLGHQFLKREFDFVPTVGWQIDPFGHSSTQAWLLSAEIGFDGLFFGRIDYQDLRKRKTEKSLELIWQPSTSLPELQVFAGAFSSGNYGPPSGFCFDVKCSDEPIIDDGDSILRNIDDKVISFIQAIKQEQQISRGNNIMLKMGADFHYTNAHMWYSNLDKIIQKINSMGVGIHMFYSTPTDYIISKAKETDVTWPTKTDDFFPYADCEHCYWTGYFTSRPTLKYLERISSSFLQTVRQLQVAASLSKHPYTRKLAVASNDAIISLAEAVGLANHHDAITGTSKQHVAYDYIRILDSALSKAERVASDLSTSLALNPVLPTASLRVCRLVNESICSVTQDMKPGDKVTLVLYNPLPKDRLQQVTLFFSSAIQESEVTIQDSEGAYLESQIFKTFSGPSKSPKSTISHRDEGAPWTLVFTAKSIPALSFSRYLIELRPKIQSPKVPLSVPVPVGVVAEESPIQLSEAGTEPLRVSNGLVSLLVNSETGLLMKIERKDEESGSVNTVAIEQDLCYYNSFGGSDLDKTSLKSDNRDPHIKNTEPFSGVLGADQSAQPSGAYIFRPSLPNEIPTCIRSSPSSLAIQSLSVVEGDEVVEVRQVFSSWATQIIRLRAKSPVIELDWSIGPIPLDKNEDGKEVMSIFRSELSSGDVFYTDSNGREYLKRTRNHRETWDLGTVYEPVSSNLYPVTTGIFLQDKASNLQLSLLTDRPQGGGSLSSGEMELMVHRRLTVDDLRGVDEPLNETDGGMSHAPSWERAGEGIRVTGRHYLLLSRLPIASNEIRGIADELFWPVAPFLSIKTEIWERASRKDLSLSIPTLTNPFITSLSGASATWPENLQLISLFKDSQNSIVLRLGHRMAAEENQAEKLQINLVSLLSVINPYGIEELTLSANQYKYDMLQRKVQWRTSENSFDKKEQFLKSFEDTLPTGVNKFFELKDVVISLRPMQIRTFRIILLNQP